VHRTQLGQLLTIHIAERDLYSMIDVYPTLKQVFGTNLDLAGKKEAICAVV